MADIGFREYDEVPQGLLQARPEDLYALLGGPALIHLEGERKDALFVSVMLHGNEHTGLLVIQSILRKYADRKLPRSISIMVGNVAAASQGKRALPGQPDYNRIWGIGDTPEHQMTRYIMDTMRERSVFAAIDIHNNSGKNPHFSLICRHDSNFYRLATLFNRTVVYALKPDTTSTVGMSELCPSVTLECGLPGDPYGVSHAAEFVEACLHLSHFPSHPMAENDMDLYHLVSIIKIPGQFSISFVQEDADIQFAEDMVAMNFSEIPAGTPFCRLGKSGDGFLEAWDEHGKNQAERFFTREGREYRLKVPVMPAMLTDDVDIIRMDCLCYLMERVDWKSIIEETETTDIPVQTS
jgi:succinylglutamate desuccinylase